MNYFITTHQTQTRITHSDKVHFVIFIVFLTFDQFKIIRFIAKL